MAELIPALTVRQPYASLILGLVPGMPHVVKDVENRSWQTAYRRVWVHSSVRRIETGPFPGGLHIPDVRSLPRGTLLGTIGITRIITDSPSIWAVPGQFHWLLTDPRPLPEPIPITGKLWCWHTEELAAITPP